MVKRLSSVRGTIRAWRPGVVIGLTREGSKDFNHELVEKRLYRSEGSIEVWKALLEEERTVQRATDHAFTNWSYKRSVKNGDRRWKVQFPEMSSVKASANSDVKYSFTSAQDGEPLQDDVRLCLGNDLKKAQDHSQRHV
ncbi:hypothetical protein Tco_1315517 [Tanacetum coccineum]